jgi:hypothetical protein
MGATTFLVSVILLGLVEVRVILDPAALASRLENLLRIARSQIFLEVLWLTRLHVHLCNSLNEGTLIRNDFCFAWLRCESAGCLITAVAEPDDGVMLEALDGCWPLHAFLAFYEEGLEL